MQTKISSLMLLMVTICCSLWPAVLRADAVTIQGQHRSISVVPAPGKVVIDGVLDDWDLSGEILSYEFVETAEKRHARTAMMYDQDALYLSVYFRDLTSPLMNMVDGHVDKSRGWDADAFQLRLLNDATIGFPVQMPKDRPVGRDIIMWFFTGKAQPTMSIHTVTINPRLEMVYDWNSAQLFFDADAGLAFRKVADGYILEGRIPWPRLGMPGPPAAGAKLPMTAQWLWGNDNGTKFSTSINDITNIGGGFTYQAVSGWGYAVFEPAGKLARPREELPKTLEVANTQSFTYPLPAARFVSLGIFAKDGQLVRTLLTAEKRAGGQVTEAWDGLNDFGDVLPAGDYTWKALSHTGLTQEWIVSLHNAGNPPWVTPDGTGSWGGDHGVPLDVACSADRVFLLWDYAEAGWNLIGCTPDGKKQWGAACYQNYQAPVSIATDGKVVFVCQQTGITMQDAATGKPVTFPGNQRGVDIDGGGATDIVYRDGHCYVLAKDKIHDLQIDKAQVVRTFPAGDGAKGLALVPNSPFLLTVASGGVVTQLDTRFGSRASRFAAPLVQPFDLTCAPDGQRVFIADRGRTEMTVKVYAYPSGKLLSTVGKPGGRPAIGTFDPHGLFMPGGLAFDARGRLWVTESDQTPKRISVWLPQGKQGTLVTDFFGPSAYSVGLSADPEKPEYVYIHNTRWIVDYDKRTAKIDCTIVRPGWFGPQPAFTGGWMGEIMSIRHVQGRTFLLAGSSVWEMLDDHAAPIYAATWLPSAVDWPVPDHTRADNWAYQCYWSDTNRDGFMQDDEVALVRNQEGIGGRSLNMGDDLAFELGGKRVGLKEWRHGLPIWFQPQEVAAAFTPHLVHWPVRWNPSRTRCYAPETNDGYYTNDMRQNGIACYTADGTKLWRFMAGIGMDLNAPLTKPGQIRGVSRVIGFAETGADKAGEVLGVNGYYGDYNLLNEDGLFVGEFCHDNRRGHVLDQTVLCPEGFGGYLVQHPKTGKVYLMGGDSDGRIWEIHGLDSLQRFHGALIITPRDVEHATKALAEFQAAGGGVNTTFSLKRPAKPVVVDGNLDEWDFSLAAKIDAGPGRGGKAVAAYDDKYLYVAYRVADDSPFVNNGADWPYLFKTGDLVDLLLCTDAAADPQRKAGKGDLRLLFAPYQGKPIVILNQKVADGGPAAPLRFTSPGQTEDYERVVQLTAAVIAVKTTPDGYTLEAAVPLATLGFAPKLRMAYPLDFGILYGDPQGAKTIMRAYWANKNTSIIGDIPTESRIVPQYLGKGQVE